MSDSSTSEDEQLANADHIENLPTSTKTHEESRITSEASNNVEEQKDPTSFSELLVLKGVCEPLCEACERVNWGRPTKIQMAALPHALKGRDIIGLAETGSGKTGAFALPILQSLLELPQKLFALVLTPTRELAFQIGQQFEALGAGIGLVVAVIVGGIDMTTQALALAKRPHIIVATPGRLVDHLENTKGFNLRAIKFLVMDEADRILNMDFEMELDKILRVIPKERRTYLFSATMTKKVAKLERASLRNPVRVEVSTRYQTVEKLKQHYIFIPFKYKEAYLVYILNELAGNTFIVFCATCNSAMQIAVLLRQLGMQAVPLHGQMGQDKRLGALNRFISKQRNILVCTDVASRAQKVLIFLMLIWLSITMYHLIQRIIYIEQVGRTARAGRAGLAITFVTQYDVEAYQKIEAHLGKKLTEYPCVEKDVMLLVERTQEANELAVKELKEMAERKKKKKRYVLRFF
ncbi:DEAD/DEAH box helicase [Dictyocaulus viviparus]|uniref:DEAD/DEAH box helicase n=1 Tax=Dictyocaulus viviparus TaxID=29172 RepID=A0A0D8XGD1_DICVI|nr:DEAD/DEAH box helicase [Dictyocaulus viviparus]